MTAVATAMKITELEVQNIRMDASRIIEYMQRIQDMTGDEIAPITFKKLDQLTKTFYSEITKYRFTTAAEYDKTAELLSSLAVGVRADIDAIREQLSDSGDVMTTISSSLPGLCERINKMSCQLAMLGGDSRGIPLNAEIELMQFLTAAKYFPLSIASWKNTLGDNIPGHVMAALDGKMRIFQDDVATLRMRIAAKYLDRK